MALHAPQLIVGARMLYLVWLPADPDAAAALVPDELQAAKGSPVFMNQYVVDDGGADLERGIGARVGRVLADVSRRRPRGARHRGRDAGPVVDALLRLLGEHDPRTHRRTACRRAAARRSSISTTGPLVATTVLDGTLAIRTTARVGLEAAHRGTGQLRY